MDALMVDIVTENQLPLCLQLKDDCTFESFYAGSNAHIINIIKRAILSPHDEFIYIWGRKGVGCSHLLQAACHFATLHQRASLYLPLKQQLNTNILQDLERTDLVCLDDLDAIAGDKLWEEAIFYLYNRIKTSQKKLIIAAQQPPKGAHIQLMDLRSRLEWGIAVQVHALEDNDLVCALQLRAKKRGMQINQEVAEFIINRVTRSMSSLYLTLEQLDVASLTLQRKITIPFVKKILKL
ncbi:DnaA regulatory inactivator Hda [Candidatus Berkiella cookevillensis]|uniref:DnaA regulatory inactivator Hda n=2 Tax=Candidatus Berkiella cookevillensis TaxID=437022 RepID=A0AAE3HQE7_9GAMM|nr:DnaA regulatory inactivator Hda [Candidatus Berkiella cookevillensis]MCS5708787.1 DnaA regulatory inactivator Hda [Candidatus Berkiella cookevillensis]